MRLSTLAILALKGTSREFRATLAANLNTSEKSLYRWIEENKDDGPLTTEPSLTAIALEAQIQDSQKKLFLTKN